jgi:hypothetical protein
LARAAGPNEWLIPDGSTVCGETIFRPEPEPLARSYNWQEELERQKSLAFNRSYSMPSAPRPTAGFARRSLRRG